MTKPPSPHHERSRRGACALAASLALVVLIPGTALAANPPAPNGDIAYSAPSSGGSVSIYSIAPDGGKPVQLTSGAQDTFPAYSPDGTELAFVRGSDVWKLSAAGPKQLAAGGSEPTWSPDGETIVYRGSPGLWAVDADGGQPRQLSSGNDWSPEFTPDGEKILFPRVLNGASKLWTMNPDGSEQAMLSEAGLYFEPAYAPDGSQIAVTASDTEPLPNFESGPAAYIETLTTAGRPTGRGYGTGTYNDQPVYSPDGTQIAFRSAATAVNATQVYVADANTGAAKAITDPSGVLFSGVTWGPRPALCGGQEATIAGSDDDDRLVGTPGPDVIVAGDGDDSVAGRGGADLICGGAGDDELRGGAQADRLRGGRGADELRGGRHVDVCRGGPGGDVRNCER